MQPINNSVEVIDRKLSEIFNDIATGKTHPDRKNNLSRVNKVSILNLATGTCRLQDKSDAMRYRRIDPKKLEMLRTLPVESVTFDLTLHDICIKMAEEPSYTTLGVPQSHTYEYLQILSIAKSLESINTQSPENQERLKALKTHLKIHDIYEDPGVGIAIYVNTPKHDQSNNTIVDALLTIKL